MKYVLIILFVLNTLDVFSQNQSLPMLQIYEGKRIITTIPLKEIDSLFPMSTKPINSLYIHKKDRTIITLPLTEIDSIIHFSIEPASLKTINVQAINNYRIKADASIVSTGKGTTSQVGFCWNSTQNPTIASQNKNSKIVNENTFSSEIFGLEKNTKYYVRAFAYNEAGISYSNQIECATLNKLDTLPETVIIGNQKWTSRNLNVSTYRNGDPIRQTLTSEEWKDATNKKEGAWCYYNHDPKNGDTYGKLYSWYAIKDPRGLAPEGFHIPSDEEWTVLTTYLGGDQIAGFKMKGTTGWTNNGNGNDSSGFNGLPGGYCDADGYFFNITDYGFWWGSSIDFSGIPLNLYLSYFEKKVLKYYTSKNKGLSVRCLKD
jgi:uncharacterized protein (TIGR02145 family)